MAYLFGNWRPGVRISTLRPKREQTALVVVCFFVGVDDENYIRALHEGVRCSNEAVEKLAFQRQVQISAEWLYLHTSTIFSAICKKISPFCKIWTDFFIFFTSLHFFNFAVFSPQRKFPEQETDQGSFRVFFSVFVEPLIFVFCDANFEG